MLTASFWVVLAVSVVTFWLLPAKWRFGFLALASFGYLFASEGSFPGPQGSGLVDQSPAHDRAALGVLAGWTLACFYLLPLGATRPALRRLMAPAFVAGLLGYLAYFKYVPTLLRAFQGGGAGVSLAIPLGISYFTFKLVHYVIETTRGKARAGSLSEFAVYIFLFPTFPAGPIERFDHFTRGREPAWSLAATVEGTTRIMHGLIKKLVVLPILLEPMARGLEPGGLVQRLDSLSTAQVWGFLFIWYLRVYLDFSAYSDVAIGCARLFGLRIMENFNWPILATNIGAFWKRWHMTLAGWCQAYVYMPALGLTRNPYLAVLATFVAIGLWHAGSLSYVAWGLWHALGVTVYLTWARLQRQGRIPRFDGPIANLGGMLVTTCFVAASFAFTVTYPGGELWRGTYTSVRILARCFFVRLP